MRKEGEGKEKEGEEPKETFLL
jgi:hypothetical protein